ncbi:MAG TPA: RusA family crossover junction endodeoxyribonuclease [Clostridiales bacterium]|nr:RusA family crossover junction endodeoxyribonuclease [Clostridiales bacterium]
MVVSFTISGEPQGKGRPRFGNGRTYTPEKTVIYENLVRMEYIRQVNHNFGDGPLAMFIEAHYTIPASASKKRQAEMREGKILPTKKPDLDNIAKAIADSLNGIAYKDDSQIVKLHMTKRYAENPCVVVGIWEAARLKKEATYER